MLDLIVLRDTAQRRVGEQLTWGARPRDKAGDSRSEPRSAGRIVPALKVGLLAPARFTAWALSADSGSTADRAATVECSSR